MKPAWLALIALLLLPSTSAGQAPAIRAQLVASGFDQPLLVTAPTGDPRLFVVDQPGRIWIVKDGVRLEAPFLDIRSRVSFGGERGLLGLAFHPDYRNNGRFFVNYTDRAGDTQVVAFRVSASNPDVADSGSAATVLSVDQPAANHNGGWIEFGPDGYLYIGMGDGGGAGDTYRTGQNKNALLGKILRIDVNGAEGRPYGIPPTNPFAQGGGAPEIFAYGLRNPWRNDFDGRNLVIADVGQNEWEEVSIVPIDGSSAGNPLNLGWPIMEGNHCYRAASCNRTGLTPAAFEYSHAGGACSITGGYVYRGLAVPPLAGQYVFADYCARFVRSFRVSGTAAGPVTDWTRQIGDVGQITSFGEDSAGELYITAEDGRVFKIMAR